jgi:hypothetical protein
MNFAKIMTFFVFLGLSATACFSPPSYSDTPSIAFESIRNVPISAGNDSVYINISFQDGTGDIGLNPNETSAPYQATNADGSSNPFFYNYFLNMYKRVNGRFVRVTFNSPDFTLNSRIPPLNPSRNSAIEGTLTYGLQFFYIFNTAFTPSISRNDTVKFEVQIADRALNRSNIIETQEIIVGRRQ